ncbi:MAG: helix-hairpin-helix domain-containing protein [Bacteroidota bacterium]
MKRVLLLYGMLFIFISAPAQENEPASSTTEQQWENTARTEDAATEDDSYLQQEEHFKKHPLNINTATVEELEELNCLTGLQVQQFLAYRRLLGELIDRYELQAIPGWDIATIKKILPYIIVTDNRNLAEKLRTRWRGGDGVLIARYGRIPEESKGYEKPLTSGASYYLGSRDRLFLRYSYNYKNVLRWGLLADKDAGEQFFKGYQRQGFDFYSFHFFVARLGIIKALALGDFTVNFGQGLVQWQSLAFKKSADVLNIKRQAATLRPYNSAGEYNFHRGAGITLQKANWETTFFLSIRKLSANTVPDSSSDDGAISSFLTSGYHRSASENEDRNSLRQTALGGKIQYRGDNGLVGISAIHYHFSKLVQKADEPYNLFALKGTSLTNAAIDYSYTWRNIHLFGEAATDDAANKAFLNGAIISLHTKAAVSILHRQISRAYRSINGSAFTENTFPVNENGIYTGLSLNISNSLHLVAYADIFRYPWLKYRVDAPSAGRDYLVQADFRPNKQTNLYLAYRSETKMINLPGTGVATSLTGHVSRNDFRLQASTVVSGPLTLKTRSEISWYNKDGTTGTGQGFTTYLDAYYKPSRKQYWRGNARLQYFETSGFDERIYTYEADAPYNSSIPFYYDRGMRYYININLDVLRLLNKIKKTPVNADLWLKWAQTIYSGKTFTGSGLDKIDGNHRSEIKFELILSL